MYRQHHRVGDRVVIELPDGPDPYGPGRYRHQTHYRWVTGIVTEIGPPGEGAGVRIRLDWPVRGCPLRDSSWSGVLISEVFAARSETWPDRRHPQHTSPGRDQPRLSADQAAELRRMHESGDYTITDLIEAFAVSRATVYRSLRRSGAN